MNAFVFIGCGKDFRREIVTSVPQLRRFTKYPIFVIDAGEGIEGYTGKQAAMLLKSGIHKFVSLAEKKFCYLDSDIMATSSEVDSIFDFPVGSFVSDHVDFTGFGKHCFGRVGGCPYDRMRQKFGVNISVGWVHANGGLFLFDQSSVEFLEHWEKNIRIIIEDDLWPGGANRDQLALAATEWQRSEQNAERIPQKFNFLVDNSDWKRRTIREQLPKIKPCFMHFYGNFGDTKFDLWNRTVN